MGIPVLCLGSSGSGKSTALRNFKREEIGIFNVASKPLPFRAKLNTMNGVNYEQIMGVLKRGNLNTYAIDDSQYLLAFDFFSKAKETGYGKFTDMAVSFYNLINFVIRQTPPDCIVYFLHHSEDTQDGKTKAKTIGKMLDEKLTVEGLFSIVLLAQTDGTTHHFITQSDGFTTAKSPMEMFDKKIDNDLEMVDNLIRDYWQLGERKTIAETNNQPQQTENTKE